MTLVTELGRYHNEAIDELGRRIFGGYDEFGRFIKQSELPLSVHIVTTIGGVDVDLRKQTLIVESTIGGRRSAEFEVIDELGAAGFQKGESVYIYDHAASLLFGGVIDKPTVIKSPTSAFKIHRITCVDWHYLAEKRRAAESYTSQTAKAIVEDLFTKYLEAEGLHLGTIETGPTIKEMVINYRPVSKAYDALARAANFIWYIDVNKYIYFTERKTAPAPWDVSSSDIIKGSAFLDGENYYYRNRQYVRGGRDITAPQIESFTGDGSTKAFTVGYPINSEPTVTVGGGGQTVGVKGLETAKQCYWSKGDPVVVFAAAPAPAAAVAITYVGEYDIIVVTEDTEQIEERKAVEGGTGIYEDIADEPYLNDRQAVFDVGLSMLDYYGVIGRQFHFTTKTRGLQPGQLVTVDYPGYGLNSTELLIERVVVKTIPTETMTYAVTAVEGPATGDWTALFKSLSGMKDEVLGRLSVGGDHILILLASDSETLELTESQTETVYSCTTCDGTACGNSVIVC